MSDKDVATNDGDVVAIVGTIPYTGAAQGTWTAGPIIYGAYERLTIEDRAVIYQASCTFSFQGTTPPPASAPVVGSEIVTVEAAKTVLQGKQLSVLRNSDFKKDAFGNTLEVKVTDSRLKSS